MRRRAREHEGTELGGFLARLGADIVELEAVEVGIYGKRLLWQVLRDRRPPGTGAVDLYELIRRAQRQLDEVERHRRDAADALGA